MASGARSDSSELTTERRGRGRPKGSKDKTPRKTKSRILPPSGRSDEWPGRPASSGAASASSSHVSPPSSGDPPPPSPASVSPEEARRATEEVDRARTERPRRPEERKAAPSRKGPAPVVVKTGRVHYVDEFGEPIPECTADSMAPVWLALGFVVRRMGMKEFTEDEVRQLAEASAPVAQKWAGTLLPFMPELALAGSLLMVMWPRVTELDRKRREDRADVNRRAAQASAPIAAANGAAA